MTRVGKVLLVIGLLLIAASAVFIHRTQGEGFDEIFSFEPKYEGHTFTYWMEHWRWDPGTSTESDEAEAALNNMGPKAVPYLLRWIKQPPSYGLKMNYPGRAVEGFEVLGPKAKSAIPTLVNEIGENSDYPMRALEAIGPDAVPALSAKLRETLKDKSKPVMSWRDPGYRHNFYHVQVAILQCLSEMGTNAEAAMPVLLEALNANHPWSTYEDPYRVIVTVGWNHPETVVTALVSELTNSASASHRGSVASALAMYGTNHTDIFLPTLIAILNDQKTDDWSRRTVAEALGSTAANSTGAVSALIQAFTNTATDYRGGIAEALGNLGPAARPAVPLLLEATHDRNFYLRKNAAIAVKKIAPEQTNSLVRLIADVKIREFRQQAIYALRSLGTNGQEALPTLLECLTNSDTQTRIDATDALVAIGETSDEFIRRMGDNLSCTNEFMVQRATKILAKLGMHSKLAFDTLIKKGMWGDLSHDDRAQDRHELVNISQENPKFMLECLNDSDWQIRYAALQVYGDLQRAVPEGLLKLRELKSGDPEPGVRDLAENILRRQDPR